VARLGWLNRMTQFKEKAGKDRENASVGLYAYPTLMAADILAYRATHVPVGDDQKQHLELARDIAQKFNIDFADAIRDAGFADGTVSFPCRSPSSWGRRPRVMSLRDGTKKMSKSDASDLSRINMTDDAMRLPRRSRRPRPIRCRCRRGSRARTTSRGRQPDRHLRGARQQDRRPTVLAEFGGQQFSAFKKALVELAVSRIGPVNAEMTRLLADPAEIDRLLADGARRARTIAGPIMDKVKDMSASCDRDGP
jgi:tryptophanyl-tRNA synthetase